MPQASPPYTSASWPRKKTGSPTWANGSRLTREEAAEQVHLRDRRRADYLKKHFHRDVTDIYQYDLLLNSTYLGEELSAELLVQAAKAKAATLLADVSA